MVPKHHIEPLLSEEQILRRIDELAKQIAHDYVGEEIVLVGVLHGGATILTDLGRALWKAGHTNVYKDYIAISSYYGGTSSTGMIEMSKELKNSVKGRVVLIIEDIVDTGRSLEAAITTIKSNDPARVATLAFLSKPSRREVEVQLDYIGFEIPNTFVVGYDMDYDEMYRTMPGIGRVVFD